MILERGQWRVRDLAMGPGTDYRVDASSNPFARSTRLDQSGPRAWAHGGYAGAQWADPLTIPIRVMIDAPPYTESAWLEALDRLSAAWRPVGSTGEIIELYRNIDGREFVWFGQPGLFEPDAEIAAGGYGWVRLGFNCPDPRRYSADLWSSETTLPLMIGGLTVPYTVPYAVEASPIGGRIEFVNEGTADSGFLARIDGPAVEPRIAVRHPSGLVQTVQFGLTLHEGQWLEVDSLRKIAPLNGSIGSNQRGNATWDMDQYPLIPGFNEVLFGAAEYAEGARLTVWARSAWW